MADHVLRPGYTRAAPNITAASKAAFDLALYMRGESRGPKSRGYKDPHFDSYSRRKLEAIHDFLNMYTHPLSATSGQWQASAHQTALAKGRGEYFAEAILRMARAYIENREVLPINPYGQWTESMLADEDLTNEVTLHLQELKDNVTAEKLTLFLRRPEIKEKYQIDRDVSVRTARRYLNQLGYRFVEAKKGQYSDGHERADVVYYRNYVYLPRIEHLYSRCRAWDSDGTPVEGPLNEGKQVIIWYHDETIFYAHDRRRRAWRHKEDIRPYQKGDGVSLMIADYISADFGWLRGPDGSNARR
ncbi:hypothetical protein K525DRAFT_214660, partial [Schizophyllum commune Loenen D]